jgi:hypothetical protein
MDFVKKAMSGGSSDASKTGGSTGTTNNNQDYGDKGKFFPKSHTRS